MDTNNAPEPGEGLQEGMQGEEAQESTGHPGEIAPRRKPEAPEFAEFIEFGNGRMLLVW